MLAANRIWNSCVWHSGETFKREGRWPTEVELKSKFKAFVSWRELHSQSAQAAVEDYFEAVRSYRKHRENGHDEANPPGFKSRGTLRTVTWKRQGFEVEENTLLLKLSRGKEPIRVDLPEGWNVVTLPDGREVKGTPVEVKAKAVVRRRKVEDLVLHVTFDLGVLPVRSSGGVSAYDYNSALVARATSSGRLDLFVCRELVALVQYRNKALAWFQEALSRCRQGSRRWRRLTQAKAKALRRLDRRVKQVEHALTKLFAELDRAEGVALAVVGDLKGLRDSARTGMKCKKASQKVNQMSYDRLQSGQRYKSLARGVAVEALSEAGTSSTCSLCGAHNPHDRRHRGLWACRRCGAVLQADLNGARNLLEKASGTLPPYDPASVRVWRWDGRLNKFVQVSSRAA